MYVTIKDIPGYLAKATYLGWRPVAEGKHYESAYFAYFSIQSWYRRTKKIITPP